MILKRFLRRNKIIKGICIKQNSLNQTKAKDLTQNKSKSRSVKQTNTIGQQVNNRLRKVWHKFCEWPGIYSMLLAVILAYSLIFFETSVGAKIA